MKDQRIDCIRRGNGRAMSRSGIKAVMLNTETATIYEKAGLDDCEKWRRAHDAPIGAERERVVRRRAKLLAVMEAAEGALYARGASPEEVRDLLMFYAECTQRTIALEAEDALLAEIEAHEDEDTEQ